MSTSTFINRSLSILLISVFLLPTLIYAQDPTDTVLTEEVVTEENTPPQEGEGIPLAPNSEENGYEDGFPPNTVSCFDYYRFGSVQVDLSPTLNQTIPGVELNFVGSIKNENPYPVVDGSVYVKIFRKSEANEDLAFQNGYPLVDQFALPDVYNLPANGSQETSFNWLVPQNAEGGEYVAAFYFQTAKRYNLLGLSFTDDVTGNIAEFEITNVEGSKLVTFNKNTVTLNGEQHRFAKPPLTFSADEAVTAKVEVTNPGKEAVAISLDWELYNWDSLRTDAIITNQSDVLELAPGETRTIEYVAEPTGTTVSYLVLKLSDGYSSQYLDIRFGRENVEDVRINFPSVESFPLREGQETGVFSCIHSTGMPVVPGNVLTLTLRDRDNNVIHTYKYEGNVTGEMMGVAERFVPAKNYSFFTLTATLERNGEVVEEVTQTYDCEKIDPKLCLADTSGGILSGITGGEEMGIMGKLSIVLAIISLTVMLVLVSIFIKRHPRPFTLSK